jgi:hypothetical protein
MTPEIPSAQLIPAPGRSARADRSGTTFDQLEAMM